MDGVAALERSYEQLAKAVGNLSADQLSGPSACSEWDLRALLNHVFGAGWMFTLVNQGEVLGEDAGDVVGDDPAKACAELATANVASWRAPGGLEGDRTYPFGTFPAPAALMVNVGEIAVHGWDVAKATGQEATIDPEVAGLLYEFYSSVPLDDFRAHGAFGPEVPVDESAPVADRVLGLLGFQP
ncbi:MAG TPA: TIGR03086 family metal-binding protein [Acidimicrobiales bacterium]|nr:TIGR03086 family metal-binding protein [Acidimicrobiales bacterium]